MISLCSGSLDSQRGSPTTQSGALNPIHYPFSGVLAKIDGSQSSKPLALNNGISESAILVKLNTPVPPTGERWGLDLNFRGLARGGTTGAVQLKQLTSD